MLLEILTESALPAEILLLMFDSSCPTPEAFELFIALERCLYLFIMCLLLFCCCFATYLNLAESFWSLVQTIRALFKSAVGFK